MSDETARQIEYLIEITQQDFELKASLLSDVVEGEVLVAEILEDIKLDIADIKDGLFKFFEEEQIRFDIQQGRATEENFRLLEALMESRGGDGAPVTPTVPLDQRAAPQGAVAGRIAAAGAGGVAGGLLAQAGSVLTRRILPLAVIAGTITAAVDYFAEFEKNLERFKEEGIDPETAMTEAATQAAGELAADFSDVILEPIGNFGLDVIAQEFGMIPSEVEKFRESIDGLSEALREGSIDIIDRLSSFFGDETSLAQERQTASELEDLEERLTEARQRQTRLGEIQSELENATGFDRLALEAERGYIQLREGPQELEQQIAETTRRGELSQAGFAAVQTQGELDTALQQQFRTEVPSSEKQEWLKENTDPLLRTAAETGAISVPLLERADMSGAVGELERAGKLVISGTPLKIENVQALENLSPQQLEAILINDDILLRSRLKGGALDNGTRKIVEYLYRVNSGQITPIAQVPNLTTQQSINQSSTVNQASTNILGQSNVERVSDMLEPAPGVSAVVPVGDMSRNVAATSSTPIVIASTQGGSTVNNMVNNNSTTVMGGGASARSSDVSHRRLQDRMQGI